MTKGSSGEKGFTIVMVCRGREGVKELMAVGPAAEAPRSKQRKDRADARRTSLLLLLFSANPRLQDVATHIQGGSYLLNQLTLETPSQIDQRVMLC